MGRVATNAEIEIAEIDERIEELMGVIPYCKTRKEAEDIQEDIEELEEKKRELEDLNEGACPECGNYEQDGDPDEDEFVCTDDYHYQ